MKPIAVKALVLAVACAAAACTTGPAQPRGVEGSWISGDGVATSRFTRGRFETTMVASGHRLTHGTYRLVPPDTVEIDVLSARGQPVSRITCLGVGTAQLACTTQSGQPFTLTRVPG